VNISYQVSVSQTMTFDNTPKTFNLGAGSVVDFGSVGLAGTNGLVKNGDGTLVLTGGAYTGGRLFGDFRGTPRPIHGGPTIG
jgi:hypothetical protein